MLLGERRPPDAERALAWRVPIGRLAEIPPVVRDALHKLMAGYHQFHAVRRAVTETRRAAAMGVPEANISGVYPLSSAALMSAPLATHDRTASMLPEMPA